MLAANSFCESTVHDYVNNCMVHVVDNFQYHVASDDVLVTEHDCLAGEDGCFPPGTVGCFGCFDSSLHFILSGLRDSCDQLQGERKREKKKLKNLLCNHQWHSNKKNKRTSFVAGLWRSTHSVACDSTILLLMKSLVVGTVCCPLKPTLYIAGLETCRPDIKKKSLSRT